MPATDAGGEVEDTGQWSSCFVEKFSFTEIRLVAGVYIVQMDFIR